MGGAQRFAATYREHFACQRKIGEVVSTSGTKLSETERNNGVNTSPSPWPGRGTVTSRSGQVVRLTNDRFHFFRNGRRSFGFVEPAGNRKGDGAKRDFSGKGRLRDKPRAP